MARHDGLQHSCAQHAALGQINGGQMGVSQLGKRKRPGSGSCVGAPSALAQGYINQRSSGGFYASQGQTAPVRISFSKLQPSSSSKTATDVLTAESSFRSGTVASLYANPFRSTEGPSSPKCRRRFASAVVAAASTTTVAHTSPKRMRDSATIMMIASSPSVSAYTHINRDDVEDTSYISTTLDSLTPTIRVNHSQSLPFSHNSSLELLPPPPRSSPSQEQQDSQTLSSLLSCTPIPSSASTTSSLESCYICHNRPRQKSDLVKFVDCARCAKRVCCVCVRECLGAGCRSRLVCSGCCIEVEGVYLRDGDEEEEEEADDNDAGGGGSGGVVRDIEQGDGSKRRSGERNFRQRFRGDGIFCWDCLNDG